MTGPKALRILVEAETSGSIAERQQGIGLGLAEWSKGDPGLEVRVLLARALSAQYRTTYDLALLSTALQVLTRDPICADDCRAAAALAAYAESLLQLGIQIRVRATPEESAMAQRNAQALEQTALTAAKWACRTASPGEPGYGESLAALGSSYSQVGMIAQAVPVLRRAVAADPVNASAWLELATCLASLSPDTPGEATTLLSAVAAVFATSNPREAFEAARFHGFWAQQRQAWSEAGHAYTRALSVRSRLRGAQNDYLSSRAWISEAGSIPSQAFCSFVRSGELASAVEVLDAGLALNLSDRLLLSPTASSSPTATSSPRDAENFILVAFDQRGGALVRVSRTRALAAVELPDATRSVLTERLLPYLGGYGVWVKEQSPLRRRQWVMELTRILDWLGSTILEPAVGLVDDDCQSLVFITDGRLGLLPVSAAPVDGRPLLERFAVSFSPNLRMLAATRQHHAQLIPLSTLAVAAPAGPGLRDLRYAELEARAVAALRGNANCMSGVGATAARVEGSMRACGVVHIASHACFDASEALNSFIQLADGRLNLARILTLDLGSVGLFVASACETAMADVGIPEEMHSLAGGLLHAGATGVAATLWAAGDRAATVLTLRFHELLVDSPGDGAAHALRLAQLWLRDVNWSQLSDWANQLGPRLPDPVSAEALTSMLSGFDGNVKPFAQPVDWACFAYFGS